MKTQNIDLRDESPDQNWFLNGAFSLWQRTTSRTGVTSDIYTADRWSVPVSGGTVTIDRQSDMPIDPDTGVAFPGFSQRILVTGAWAAGPNATNFLTIRQTVEGYNARFLKRSSGVISGWVKTSVAGVYSVSVRDSVGTFGYIYEYTLAADAWTFIEIPVPRIPNTGGSFDFTTGVGLQVQFCLTSGANFKQAATTDWGVIVSNAIAGNNQVNFGATNGATFFMTRMAFNAGTDPAPFSTFGKSFLGELRACQRYFEKSYAIEENLASVNGSTGFFHSIAINSADFYCYGRVKFQVQKRATPAISTWSYSGTAGVLYSLSVSANQGNTGVRYQSQNGFGIFCNNNAMTTGHAVASHWAADAEL